ncbi:MAG TPA: hypothetical protein VJV39_21115 [Dongiaceae bacterium]|nr:hypothetical protein [Dongiaceae bacterium]
MTLTLTLWLGRLRSSSPGKGPLSPSTDRKPLEIEVERLPDYLWRNLGFPAPQHRE